jgi:hypothetical protein
MVTGSTISNNLASRQGLGGGIYNAGLLTVEESTVFKNTATGTTAWGGGICIVPRTSPISTTVKGSTVSGNSAIAVLHGVGEAYSYGSGGGIYYSGGVLLIEGSTISNNVVSGTDVQGAGIYALGSNANVTVDSSTISGNSASGRSPVTVAGFYDLLRVFVYAHGSEWEQDHQELLVGPGRRHCLFWGGNRNHLIGQHGQRKYS